jgi:ribulose-5-phosphate 4-epimerase/fuculose-1-phosphate aldolase
MTATQVQAQVLSERELRQQLAATYRLVAMFGWDEAIQNHISVRHPTNRSKFLVNPYGLLFDEIKASDLIEVDMDGSPSDPNTALANPTVFVLHTAAYEARPEINCVVHFHSAACAAVSAQADGLLPISAHAVLYRDAIAYHEFEGLSLDRSEKDRIRIALGNRTLVVILRNHGLLAVGRSVAEAFMHAFWIENACAAQVLAMGGGAKLHFPSQAIQDKTSQQFFDLLDNGYAGQQAFDAFVRKLDRLDPSYRN